MKKVLAALLCVVTLLCCVSCSAGKDPYDGYMLASLPDEMFDLYVPKNWQNGVENGVSGGYSSGGMSTIGSGVMANAAVFEAEEGTALADFVKTVIAEYEETVPAFRQKTEPVEATLGELPALSFEYTMHWSDQTAEEEMTLRFRCTVAQKAGSSMFAVLSCCAPEDIFDMRTQEFDDIAAFFAFRDAPVGGNTVAQKDENTPDGYQLASGSLYEFRFYVPETWKVKEGGNLPSATYSNEDASNVSLTTFRMTPSVTDGKSYWESFKANCEFPLSDVVEDENAKLGGYAAYGVEYTMAVKDVNYKIRQVFLSGGSMIYIFTYTSDEAHYAEHMDDVENMIKEFEFKK